LDIREIQHDFVHVAPAPILSGLEGSHDGVLSVMKVLGGMLVLRGVTAAYVAASEAQPKMHPGVAQFEALLTAAGAGAYVPNHSEM
jgi:hypothetical protein